MRYQFVYRFPCEIEAGEAGSKTLILMPVATKTLEAPNADAAFASARDFIRGSTLTTEDDLNYQCQIVSMTLMQSGTQVPL